MRKLGCLIRHQELAILHQEAAGAHCGDYAAAIDAKQQMAVDITAVKRCWRVVIEHDHIRSCTGAQYPQRGLEIAVGNTCIILKQHGRHFAPGSSGIAEMMFMQHVCYFVGFKHVMRIAICPQAGQNAAVAELHRRWATAGIAHV